MDKLSNEESPSKHLFTPCETCQMTVGEIKYISAQNSFFSKEIKLRKVCLVNRSDFQMETTNTPKEEAKIPYQSFDPICILCSDCALKMNPEQNKRTIWGFLNMVSNITPAPQQVLFMGRNMVQ